MIVGDLFDDRPLLRLLIGEQPIGFVDADHGQVGVDGHDLQPVELAQIVTDGQGGAGHSADGPIAVDELFDGHLVEDLSAVGGVEALLGFDSGLESIGPTLEFGDASAGRGDEFDPSVDDEVIDIAFDQRPGVESEIDGGERLGILSEEFDVELFLDPVDSGIGERDGMAVGADLVVGARAEPGYECGDRGVGVLDTGRAGEDQRHTRFVDEHGIGLIDDDDIAFGNPLIGILGEEPVPEDIESDLGHRGVDDLGAVGFTAFVFALRAGDRG